MVCASCFRLTRSSKGDGVSGRGGKAVSSNHSKEGGDGVSSGRGSSKGGSGREYSAEEDAAIVSWVSRGTRARSVNGNRLWRELQGHHQQATGTG